MRILIICRDNIGDTLLTTPLISALNETEGYEVDVLTNNYAAPVLENNPHIRKLFFYTKLHHLENGQSRLMSLIQRLKMTLALKQQKYDVVILAKTQWDHHSLKWVKSIRPRQVIALGTEHHHLITTLLPREKDPDWHICQILFSLSRPFSLQRNTPGALVLNPDKSLRQRLRTDIDLDENKPIYALQISSRKASQQWEALAFAELAKRLCNEHSCQVMLLWSPGSKDNPRHPGDDEKAQEIMQLCAHMPVEAVPTTHLSALISAMSLCDGLVSSDGGAMHIGAALGLPIVALFGDSDPANWRPWGVKHQVLQHATRDVKALSVDDVYAAVVETLITP